MRRPLPALAIVVLTALALAGCTGGDDAAPADDVARAAPVTSAASTSVADDADADAAADGAPRARIFMPAGDARAIVVLLHGWNDLDPAAYGAWIDHLIRHDVAVVFPDYQEGLLSGPGSMLAGAEQGIREGLAEARRLGAEGPVVAAGYSLGGGMAVVYAAEAAAWGVESPAAVYAVFPAEPLGLPAELGDVPEGTTVELVVGDRDVVVGRGGADALAERIAPHPARVRVLASAATVEYDHFAPKREDAQAQADFWAPLDRLVDDAAPR